ncbi:MAG TPA: tRNA (adenosine(37)-N6)-threonylcarbamoyltransferase complex transferase subunit TsaD [bacterium]
MITLGIETSCDETAIGILEDRRVRSNVVSSQIVHTKYGGVVPELAARNHIKVIVPLVNVALEIAGCGLRDIGLISVTRGPGLMGSLLVGLSYAKALAVALKKPFIGTNHLEGHIYTLHVGGKGPAYPYLVLLVSGGHTELVLVKKEFNYVTIGRTVDDACGEAFDKVAKLIGLPYPGGPYIEKYALKGQLGAIRFPVPKAGRYDFSYAGLKTAVLYYVQQYGNSRLADIAANFQESALSQLVQVTKKAVLDLGVKDVGLVGGVSANQTLQNKLLKLGQETGCQIHVPDREYCTDNGAMIAMAGARRYKRFGGSNLNIDAVAREDLEEIP